MKTKILETAKLKADNENEKLIEINLKEFHSFEYLKKMKETTYKGKKVVFILPDKGRMTYE